MFFNPLCYKIYPVIIPLIALSSFPVFSHLAIDEQIKEISQQIEKIPNSAEFYVKRGELYRQHEKWDKALADFAHAKELDRDHETVDIFLSKTYLDIGKPDKAKELLDQFLKRKPDHVTARILRATTEEKLKDYRAAAADYSHAILNFRDSAKPQPYFYINRAKALVAASDRLIDEAIAGLDKGLETLGSIASIQVYAVELELKRNSHDGALRRLNAMASWYGQNPKLLVRIAEVSKIAGRFDEARQACNQAITLVEKLPTHRRKQNWVIEVRKRIAGCIKTIPEKT